MLNIKFNEDYQFKIEKNIDNYVIAKKEIQIHIKYY
jgi:hypothetical protein